MTTTAPNALDGDDPLAHALTYAALGWRTVPIVPGQKRPSMPDWTNVATTDVELITQWYTANRDHGVGLVTGVGSNVWALDVDPGHGGDDTLATLEATHGRLPATVEAITGGGGRHLLFRWPNLRDDQRLTNSAGRLGPGLDVRAQGGQIVVAPTMHPNGRRYQWEASSRPGEVEVAEAPAWLLALVIEDTTPTPEGQVGHQGADLTFAWDRFSFADGANQRAVTLLERHGWHSPHTDRDGVTYLTRPGKGSSEGPGVSVGKIGPGITYCFTSEAPPLEAEHGYRLAELYALLEHQGDRVAADGALVAAGWGAATHAIDPDWIWEWAATPPAATAAAVVVEDGPQPIHWPSFWTREHIGEDWLVHPILPRGRQVALWARHKTGKSLITLEVAAALATGRACLSQPAADPIDVVYLDMEMTEDDVHERLVDLDYGPDDDMSRLHYYLLPSLPPLDTEAGGKALHAIVRRHEAQAVVIDTMARVVAGDENDADTYRDFYRCCGMGLKAMGVSVLRLDHGGKDPTKGQRGSSSKGDDVDVVWQLRIVEGGLELKRDVTRVNWVPERVSLLRNAAPLRHMVTGGGMWPEGTTEVAQKMRDMGITSTMSQNQAVKQYRSAGGEGENVVLRAAYKHLKEIETREMFAKKDRRPWDG